MKFRKRSANTQIIGMHMPGTFILAGEYSSGIGGREFIIHGGERVQPEDAGVSLFGLRNSYDQAKNFIEVEFSSEELDDILKNGSDPECFTTINEESERSSVKKGSIFTSTLNEIISKRADEILNQFISSSAPPKVALTPHHSMKNIEKLFDVKMSVLLNGDVLIFSSLSDPNQSFCLVKPSLENYRKIYVDFINGQYNSNFTISGIPSGYEVDHMLAKSNAPTSAWIRIEVILGAVNRSHGGGVEKRNSASGVVLRRKEDEYHHGSMTWISAAKLAELKSPLLAKSKNAKERLELLIDYFVKAGFDKALVERGIGASIHGKK